MQAIADGTYPSPPARFENLATKGKPTGLALGIHQVDPDGRTAVPGCRRIRAALDRAAGRISGKTEVVQDAAGHPDRDPAVSAEGRHDNRPSAAARLRADRSARQDAVGRHASAGAADRCHHDCADPPILAHPWAPGRLDQTVLGQTWKPQDGLFGFWPFIAGTAWVTVVGMGLAIGPCVLVALYLSEYAQSTTRTLAKPILDLLAAIPPVVYGVWGLLAVVPFVEHTACAICQALAAAPSPIFAVNQPTGFSILAGGIVLAVMVAPFIIAVLYEILDTVPEDLRHASLAVGATRWQTIRGVVIPKVLPGMVAGIVLGGSRALGETIAVLMVVGNVIQVPTSIFDAAYPLPALIANNYGDMMSIPLYDAALLGGALVLLVVILIFNILSTLVLQRLLGRRLDMRKGRWVRRHLAEAVVKGLMYLSVALVTGSLALILLTVILRGLPAMSWEMVSQPPEGGYFMGKGGGVLNAIIGSCTLPAAGRCWPC